MITVAFELAYKKKKQREKEKTKLKKEKKSKQKKKKKGEEPPSFGKWTSDKIRL